MKIALNANQMKRADITTQEKYKVPSCVLMERAAYSVYEVIRGRLDASLGPVVIACGTGNNGGDGLALARMLHQAGYDVRPFIVGNIDNCSEECARQLEILKAYGVDAASDIPVDITPAAVVDSIFGTGLSRDITGSYAEKIEALNGMPGLKVAIDIPSGISSDTGAVLGVAFKADITVTFAYAKCGHLVCPGRIYAGELIVSDIGIDGQSLEEGLLYASYPDKSDLLALPKRIADSNKGTYGKVLCVTGSRNMAGASLFAARSAYMTGAGLVRIFAPEENRVILQSSLPEAVLISYDTDSIRMKEKLENALDDATVIAAGSGISMGEDAYSNLNTLLSLGRAPLVLDADGINLVSASEELSHLLTWYPAKKVLTPHLKEASRLLKCEVDDVKKDIIGSAKAISEEFRCECVLKDAATVTALSNGRVIINTSGNNSMAKGGSGDVLTGIIAGLISTGAEPSDAAWLGAYIHGLAGEEASSVLGLYSVLASDLIDAISAVLSEV